MNPLEETVKSYIREHNIIADHLRFAQSCHSVADAAKAVQGDIDEFVKNICLIDTANNLIVAIVKGEDTVSIEKVALVLKIEKPRIATKEEVLLKTGYPAGGVPSFGYQAVFILDEKVMEKETVYTGGGSEMSLIRISSSQLQKANEGIIGVIRK